MSYFKYDDKSALIVVDMQHDFVHGSLAVEGGFQVAGAIWNEIAAARMYEAKVIWTQDWHPEKTPHFDAWPVHCVAGTTGAEIISSLRREIAPEDLVVKKGQGQEDGYSGFETGELAKYLQDNNIRKVHCVGLAGDFCVKATAFDSPVPAYVSLSLTRFVNTAPEQIASQIRWLSKEGVSILP